MIKTDTDLQYKSVCNRIGVALLTFYVIFNVLSVGITTAQQVVLEYYPSDLIDTLFNLAYYVSYLFAFMFPVYVFRRVSKGRTLPDLRLEFKVSKNLWWIVPAAVGVNFLMAEINHILLLPINFSELISQPVPENYYAHNLILDIIGTAIVPAFCEEFLFRGLILSALLPYGKKTAVIGSAVLFGLMHQNPGQMLYTVVLGVILAYVTLDSGSIWGGIIIHFANNFISVIMTAVVYMLPESISSIIYASMFYGIMAVGVVISIIWLSLYISKRNKRKKELAERAELAKFASEAGLFGVSTLVESTDGKPQYALTKKYARRGFFAPCNLIFILLAVGNMVLLLGLAAIMNVGA